MRAVPAETLKRLAVRSDARGALRLAIHVTLLAGGGLLIHLAWGTWWLAPAWVLQGAVIMALFAPMHECIHYTAFRSRRINEVVAFLCGAAIGHTAAYYRHFHIAHHRYTQDPARDPELITAPEPRTRAQYWRRASGVDYWRTRVGQLWRLPLGRFDGLDYILPAARPEIVRASRRLVGLYALVVVASLATGSWVAVISWLIPALLGNPLLRFYLMAEHGGCSNDDNAFSNTRTTLTHPFVRLLMWNMPYHAEHHLYPHIAFHQLPALHALLRDRLAVVATGYWSAHRAMRAGLVG
ncbi:MAG TPA: fatty acid desaturase [Vineibacter sp.]|nr:fatty acid desaturase [Vineibacter sp.]